MPRDIPIIFSGPMVLALLAGRKTMTRRLASSPLSKVSVGDRMYVRESLARRTGVSGFGAPTTNGPQIALYAADGAAVRDHSGVSCAPWWRGNGGTPSIHMPRWASRLTLVVTATKIERLHDISFDECRAEGWPVSEPFPYDDHEVNRDAARDWFSDLWEDLHGVDGWRSNPDVVALSFRVVHENIDRVAA